MRRKEKPHCYKCKGFKHMRNECPNLIKEKENDKKKENEKKEKGKKILNARMESDDELI